MDLLLSNNQTRGLHARKFLEEIYKKQKKWAIGSDINKINNLIKKVGLNFDLTEEKMDDCLKNDEAQDEILNQRISAEEI